MALSQGTGGLELAPSAARSAWIEHGRPQALFPSPSSVEECARKEGKGMKKFLILLGILGIVIAIVLAVRNRQESLEFDYGE